MDKKKLTLEEAYCIITNQHPKYMDGPYPKEYQEAYSLIEEYISVIGDLSPEELKTLLEAFYVAADETMGNSSRYEINIYACEKDRYEKFKKGLTLYDTKFCSKK